MEPSGHVCPADKVDGLPVLLRLTRLLRLKWWILLCNLRQKRPLNIFLCVAARCEAHSGVGVRTLRRDEVPRGPLKLPGPQLPVITGLSQKFLAPFDCQFLHELVGPEGYKLGMTCGAGDNGIASVGFGQGKKDAVSSAMWSDWQ